MGIFSRLDIPERFISDNQTCFTSAECAQFTKELNFEHVTSSPHHSQENGFSEAYVKMCKCIFTKAKSTNTDPFIGLLEYRNTKLSSTNFSPAALLKSRKLRSILPTSKEKLKPHAISPEIVHTRLQAYKKVEESYFNRRTKRLEPLDLGGSARVQNMQKKKKKKWQQTVISDNGISKFDQVKYLLINTMTDHIQYAHQMMQQGCHIFYFEIP